MKTFLISFLLVLSFLSARSQNLSAYIDYKNYFYVYDDGPNIEMEYQPIKSYRVGGNAVAYVNGTDNFKVYFNGITYNLLDVAPSNYIASQNYIVYFLNRVLTVFDRGKKTYLAMYAEKYMVGDSIVAVSDHNSSTFRVYYDGKMAELETIGNRTFTNFKTGANILAYASSNEHFKIFYRSKIFDIESSIPLSYEAGSNVVAYIDRYTQSFKVFYAGNTYTLENFPPISYEVGDNTVAYVDNNRNFKIFYLGQTFTVSSFAPAFYTAKDKIVVYYDNQNFTAFYKGKITRLESYIPEKYQVDFNHLAYIDRNGHLRALYNGVLQQISKETTNAFELNGNVMKYNARLSDILFFCNGKIILH